MRILYCIVHYGNFSVTKKCLFSLGFSNYENVLLIYVPQNVKDNLLPTTNLTSQFKNINTLILKKNGGYAYACNHGISFMKKHHYEYILIANNDTYYPKNFVKTLQKHIKDHSIDIVGFTIRNERGQIWFQGGQIDPIRWSGGHIKGKKDYVSGCSMLLSRKIIKSVGLFDESYFMYYEDVDYCYRAKMKNTRINILPIEINHITEKKVSEKNFMEYYLARNRIMFMKKFAPKKIIYRELIRLPKTTLEYIKAKNFAGLKGFLKGFCMHVKSVDSRGFEPLSFRM